MNEIWEVLGIAPTGDKRAIRSAYSVLVKQCHPEEDPQGFKRLHEAYQAALAYAAGKVNIIVGTECQHHQNFIQRFPLADQFLRGGAVGQAALRSDYVLVKFAPVPMPPLFVGKVLRFVVGLGEIFVDLYRNGHGLPIVVDGNFHRPFLRSDFWGLNEGGGERQRGHGGWPGNTKAPGQLKAVRVLGTT